MRRYEFFFRYQFVFVFCSVKKNAKKKFIIRGGIFILSCFFSTTKKKQFLSSQPFLIFHFFWGGRLFFIIDTFILHIFFWVRFGTVALPYHIYIYRGVPNYWAVQISVCICFMCIWTIFILFQSFHMFNSALAVVRTEPRVQINMKRYTH